MVKGDWRSSYETRINNGESTCSDGVGKFISTPVLKRFLLGKARVKEQKEN